MFYPQGITIKSVKTSRDEIKFTLKTIVNVYYQKYMKLFLSAFNESNCCTFNIQSGKPVRSSKKYALQSLLWEQNSHNRL